MTAKGKNSKRGKSTKIVIDLNEMPIVTLVTFYDGLTRIKGHENKIAKKIYKYFEKKSTWALNNIMNPPPKKQ